VTWWRLRPHQDEGKREAIKPSCRPQSTNSSTSTKAPFELEGATEGQIKKGPGDDESGPTPGRPIVEKRLTRSCVKPRPGLTMDPVAKDGDPLPAPPLSAEYGPGRSNCKAPAQLATAVLRTSAVSAK